MKKNVLFVVDERCTGGVSVLLTDIFNMIDTTQLDIDLLVLHNRGKMFEKLPSNVHLIFGNSYFDAVDLSLITALKSKNLKTIFHKIRLIAELKTGLIKKRIVWERKKILKKHYDYEIAFKDGFTAVFTAYGDSDIKYHWIQYNYRTANPNSKYPKLFAEVLKKFDKIIAVSQGIADDFNHIYHLESKMKIISNLVDNERIKKLAKENSDLVIDKNKLNIICVGRLINSHKGYDRLIDIVNRLNQENLFSDCILRIFGDGPDFVNLENQIINCHLEDKVFLMGAVNNPYKYFNDQDLFILPSYYEAFGLVIVESLILHVPVLATKNDNTDLMINNQKNGLIVENSTKGLYDGLKYLLENRAVLEEYKENLLNYIYDNREIICEINKLFDK
ncbi:MAG: glycosyltransferase [Erysipelotrichia bacterium]|nr:glycosyltransferase [Erysipelotrichia bacterium]